MTSKVIIFDMDGVLIDSIKIAREFLKLGYPGLSDEIQKEIQCGNFHEEIKKYAHLKNPENEEEKKARHIKYAEIKSQALLYGGTKEFLEKLHGMKYILTINTSAYDRNCFSVLEKTKIKQYFDFIATADFSKSKVEKFKFIKDKYKVDKKNILFITDTLGDVIEAEIADIPTVAVTWGGHDRSFFEREKHLNLISIIDSIEELKDFIEKY
jgi:HAD superfamily hydrolase (TIGR01549 family)